MPQKKPPRQSVNKTAARKKTPKNKGAADRKPPRLSKADISAAALALAAGPSGWAAVTPEGIARRLHRPVEDISRLAPDTARIIALVLDGVQQETAATVSRYLLPAAQWRDNLVEILMTRFDIAQRHRAAFASLPAFMRSHPQVAAGLLPVAVETMDHLLSLAGLQPRLVDSLAFFPFYISMVTVWQKDDGPDMAKTMAAIDKSIGKYARLRDAISC